MPTYLYETVPENEKDASEQLELRQSMRDEPLRHHPVTGRPVRRIITGGFGFLKVRSGSTSVHAAHDSGCCAGCHD